MTTTLKTATYCAILFLITLGQCFAQSVTVYSAASLTQPINELVKRFEKKSDIQVITVFASSSTLARQIAHGAPADIYISANQKWMNYLATEKKILHKSITPLLENELVLVAPLNSSLASIDLTDKTQINSALKEDRLATGNTDHVPLGLYAKQALQTLNLWQSLKGKLALTNNARSALAFAERGATPLAIVYATDALSSNKVKILAKIERNTHSNIEYPIALINKPHNSQTQQFFNYLKSSSAINVFQQFGFTIAPAILKKKNQN